MPDSAFYRTILHLYIPVMCDAGAGMSAPESVRGNEKRALGQTFDLNDGLNIFFNVVQGVLP